jgi:hypothetical protein
MASKLERDVWLLKGYALLVTATVGILFLCSFRSQPKKEKFEEIDVQRINIVGKDGTLRMVITNKELSPQRLEHGVAYGRSGDRVGLIFYNDEGTENGGLTFGSFRQGGRLEAGGLLAFDQYDQDQTVALQYYEHDGRRRSGLGIAEYPSRITNRQREEEYEQIKNLPDGPAKQEAMRRLSELEARNRAYFGRDESGAAILRLADANGKPRLRLRVDAGGSARIEFLDENGKTIESLPESSGR